MVSDFLTAEWGRLCDNIRSFLFYFFLCTLLTTLPCSEAHIVFKLSKNRNGFFDSTELITQVNHTIDIFEGKAKGLTQGLFLFDNVPSHLKCSADAISATKMVKSVCVFFFCYFDILISCKIPSASEHTIWRGHTCTMASIPWWAPLNCFTFQMTTPPIWGGLKVWRTSFMSTAFGLRGASLPTVLALSVLRDRPAAAAVTSFIHNLTLHHRSPCSRNSSSHMVICVITILNTTVSWISLSNTGKLLRADFVYRADR